MSSTALNGGLHGSVLGDPMRRSILESFTYISITFDRVIWCADRYSWGCTFPMCREAYLHFIESYQFPGTCVQYPGLQGGGALGDATTPNTPAGSIAASAHGGTNSHAAVAGRTWGGERGAAAATAAAAARWRRATPTGGAVTPPRSAPAHGGQGGRQATADTPPQQKPARRHDHPRVIAGAFNPRSRCARSTRPTRGGREW